MDHKIAACIQLDRLKLCFHGSYAVETFQKQILTVARALGVPFEGYPSSKYELLRIFQATMAASERLIDDALEPFEPDPEI